LGFARDWYLVQTVNFGVQLDVYLLGLSFPNNLLNVLSASLITTMVPILVRSFEGESRSQFGELAFRATSRTFIYSSIATILLWLMLPYLVPIAFHFEREKMNFFVPVAKITVLTIPIVLSISILQNVYIAANKTFFGVVLTSIPTLISFLVQMILKQNMAISLAVVNLISMLIVLLMAFAHLFLAGNLKPCRVFGVKISSKRHSAQMTIATCLHQLMQFVEQIAFSKLANGMTSALTYGMRIPQTISSVSEGVVNNFYGRLFNSRSAQKVHKSEVRFFVEAFVVGLFLALLLSFSSHSLVALLYGNKVEKNLLGKVVLSQIISTGMLPFSLMQSVIVQKIRSQDNYFAFIVMSGCQLAAKVVVLGTDWFGDQAVPVSVVISYAVGGMVTIILIFRSKQAV
jgi:peptidoglycan biosynthesis protein MviN/MurJ (putative lipid II flippase)